MIIGLYDDDIGISKYQPAHLLLKFKLLVIKGAPTYTYNETFSRKILVELRLLIAWQI